MQHAARGFKMTALYVAYGLSGHAVNFIISSRLILDNDHKEAANMCYVYVYTYAGPIMGV